MSRENENRALADGRGSQEGLSLTPMRDDLLIVLAQRGNRKLPEHMCDLPLPDVQRAVALWRVLAGCGGDEDDVRGEG